MGVSGKGKKSREKKGKKKKKIIEANQRYGEDRKNLYSETLVGHVRCCQSHCRNTGQHGR